VRLLAQLSEGQKQREVVQYDTVSTMSMRIPAAWMMSRRDESEVDEDTGCVVSCVESMLVARQLHQQKNEKLRYIAFFRSETQILNFLSRCFS